MRLSTTCGYAPDGGVLFDSIAQTNLVFLVSKRELTDERYRGTLQADTLRQILVKIAQTVGVRPERKPPVTALAYLAWGGADVDGR